MQPLCISRTEDVSLCGQLFICFVGSLWGEWLSKQLLSHWIVVIPELSLYLRVYGHIQPGLWHRRGHCLKGLQCEIYLQQLTHLITQLVIVWSW